jgi:transposase
MSDTELTSMPEPARRIEIFTGAGRRRVWPAAVKAEIIAEIGIDGATVSAVARRHGLTVGQLFAWRGAARRSGVRLRAGGERAAVDVIGSAEEGSPGGAVRAAAG